MCSARQRGWLRRLATAVLAVALALAVVAPAGAVVPLGAGYQATITGTVSEWNSFVNAYQVTGNVNLPALLFVEPHLVSPRPDEPVIGLFTGETPALDDRPGAINFATNSQGFAVEQGFVNPTVAAVDIASVQANVAAGTVAVTVDELAARALTVELFRTQSSLISAPAQILAGTMTLRFSADARTVSGSFDLGGNGLIEPGNTLLRVRRYTAAINGTATGPLVLSGASGGGTGGVSLRSVRAPRGGVVAARRSGVAVALRCPGACDARVALSISKALARRARLHGTTVGSASALRTSAGALTLHARLTHAAAVRLARFQPLHVTAAVTVVGTADASFRRTVTLRAARRR